MRMGRITMGKVTCALVCGVAIGLGAADWFASLSTGVCEYSRSSTAPEPLYRSQPTSFWIAQLQDRDQSFRQQAIQALEQIGPKDQKVVPALAGMLKDQSRGVRLGAAFALRRLGRQAEPAVPNLISALHDDDCFVRLNAAYALAGIGLQEERITAALVPLLQDQSARVQQAVITTMATFGAGSASSEVGNDSDPEVQTESRVWRTANDKQRGDTSPSQ
jgi:HEAT repeats